MSIALASLIVAVAAVAFARAWAVYRMGGFAIRFPTPPRRDRRRHTQLVQAGASPIWIRERALKGARAVAVQLRRMRESHGRRS